MKISLYIQRLRSIFNKLTMSPPNNISLTLKTHKVILTKRTYVTSDDCLSCPASNHINVVVGSQSLLALIGL